MEEPLWRAPIARRTLLALLCAALVTFTVPAAAAPTDLKMRMRSDARGAVLPPASFGNGVFQVYLQRTRGFGIGSFTVLTGPDHPAGPRQNVLSGDGVPGTSFMTVRNLTTGKDFVQSPYLTQPNQVELDEQNGFVLQLTPTSSHTLWSLPLSSGDTVTLFQDIVVHGTTLADTTIEVTTGTIRDTQDKLQVQYLWDVAVGADDGPVSQQTSESGFQPFATPVTHERTFTGANSFAVTDNNFPAPTFAAGFTGTGPARVTPAPTAPESVKFVCWPRAVGAVAGGYETDPLADVSTQASDCRQTGSGPDSALLYLFPAQQSQAGLRVSASIFSSPAAPHPAAIAVAPARLGSPSLSATLTDAGQPVVGRKLSFSAGDRALCSAVTGPNGVAACGGAAEGTAALPGYSAVFAGDAVWAASTGKR
ncbi:hypothetical protein UK23_33835 [Lentzea aerocolonigenes]|uniref:Big-1 domain-containing protein n=1 Tax=Lentzea aerocolonigenes TaxID=68170 RepID=A0A0F0GID6_LENAE|nr:hypothetical protein [Lentzea aerocolonigenes]KJK43294.1 hypothetical protein UK23_33835 [Lentzea aerocolonigenes]